MTGHPVESELLLVCRPSRSAHRFVYTCAFVGTHSLELPGFCFGTASACLGDRRQEVSWIYTTRRFTPQKRTRGSPYDPIKALIAFAVRDSLQSCLRADQCGRKAETLDFARLFVLQHHDLCCEPELFRREVRESAMTLCSQGTIARNQFVRGQLHLAPCRCGCLRGWI